jgi:hypothetical protein
MKTDNPGGGLEGIVPQGPSCPEPWGKTWRLTPTRREQRLWTWACSKAGQKLIPFILAAIHERCRQVAQDRIARGRPVEQWVAEVLNKPESER